jgi:lipoprotein-releasing system ATP-binding protein
MTSSPLLKLQNVSKTYTNPDLDVLNNVSLEIQTAQTLAIIGPSGSGKSTLLNIMGALDKPTAGQVFFDNKNLSELNDTQLAILRNQRLGFIFQSHHLLPQCTTYENVLIPTLAGHNQTPKTQLKDRALNLLEQVGLQDHLSHRPAQLSGGQCQRVAVVRALINQPQIILADEPTGALDHKNAQSLIDLLLQLNQQHNVTLVLVSHDFEIANKMQTIHHLTDGQIQ